MVVDQRDENARPPRPEKVAAVEDIAGRLKESPAVFVTEYRGLSVSAFQSLRRSLRAVGAECSVVKCTLARRAAEVAELDDIQPVLEGPIALVYAGEEIAGAAKALSDFAKDHEQLVIKAGLLEGARLEAADVKAIATLPSRDVLLSEIAGLFEAPLSQFAALLAAPLQDFLALQDALISKREEESAA